MDAGSNLCQEGPHAFLSIRLSPPPRTTRTARPRRASQLWQALTVDRRQRILSALGRVVAEHLRHPPLLQEVTHEQS
jgi:hypothetical protein